MAPGGFVGDNEFQYSVRCGRMRIRQADHAGNVEDFMNGRASIPTLRIGLIGSGFIANFHLQALLSVRHVIVLGRLQSDRRQPRSDCRKGQRAGTRPVPTVSVARSHADFRRGRRGVDRRAEFRPARHHARDLAW
jgi:hypothetical protein